MSFQFADTQKYQNWNNQFKKIHLEFTQPACTKHFLRMKKNLDEFESFARREKLKHLFLLAEQLGLVDLVKYVFRKVDQHVMKFLKKKSLKPNN